MFYVRRSNLLVHVTVDRQCVYYFADTSSNAWNIYVISLTRHESGR